CGGNRMKSVLCRHRLALLIMGVGSMSAALLSSALAETCVTGVNTASTDVVNSVGQTAAAVTAVTPSTASITNITNPTTVNTVAVISPGIFFQNGGSDVVMATNPPGIQNVPVVTGTPTSQTVVKAINQTTAQFLTGVGATTTPVVSAVLADNSGASASAG